MCDFDGTITVQDTAEWILDKYADGDWRELDDCYVQGKISLLDCMRQQFAMVRTDRSEMLRELDKAIVLRAGFAELVGLCANYGTQVIVVSAGVDFVIEHFMRKLKVLSKVEIHSATTFADSDHLGFQFPELVIPGSKTFKDDVVLQWKRRGFVVTYLGDGMPDTDACALSDHRFAVKGRRLETALSQKGLVFTPFIDFLNILPAIEDILKGKIE